MHTTNMRGFPRIKWILGIFMGLLWRFSPLKERLFRQCVIVRVHTTVFGVHHLFSIVPVDMGRCQIFSDIKVPLAEDNWVPLVVQYSP